MSGTKTPSTAGWLTLQAWGGQDQVSPAGIPGSLTLPYLPPPSVRNMTPPATAGRIHEACCLHKGQGEASWGHLSLTALLQAGPGWAPSWLTFVPIRPEFWKQRKLLLIL